MIERLVDVTLAEGKEFVFEFAELTDLNENHEEFGKKEAAIFRCPGAPGMYLAVPLDELPDNKAPRFLIIQLLVGVDESIEKAIKIFGHVPQAAKILDAKEVPSAKDKTKVN